MVMLVAIVMLLTPVLLCNAAQQTVEVTLSGTDVSMGVNGKLINFPDQKPYITEGRALIPVRFISEALGAQVQWNDPQINIQTQDKLIVLTVGSKAATANNSPISLDVPVAISGGRVIVPLGFVSQVLGAEVKWRQADSSQPADNKFANKIWRVTSETTYPPFEFVQKEQYVGYDMDLIQAVGAVEGYDVKIMPVGFDVLISTLQNDQADCVISAMTINPYRLQVVDASEPYFTDGLVVAVQKDNQTITGMEDLRGKKLGAEVGTIGLEACNEVKTKDSATTVLVFDSIGEAFLDLENGSIDAVISDWALTRYYCMTKGTTLKTVEATFQPRINEAYGIYVRQGNSSLLEMINDGLKKTKADGTMDQLQRKWFGESQVVPQSTKKDFNFILKYGIGAKNEIDTFNGTSTKDLIAAGNTTIDLELTASELSAIEKQMREINILNYPEKFEPDPSRYVTPNITYYLIINMDGKTKKIQWEDYNCYGEWLQPVKATQLRNVFKNVIMTIEQKEEYKKLPQAVGGYD